MALFVSSFLFLMYIHFFYPLLLICLGFYKNLIKEPKDNQEVFSASLFPKISVVIAAYNEQLIIEKKIQNTLDLIYPKNLLEIIVFSDGSTDQTDNIVSNYLKHGVRLLRLEGRIGKTA